jgi:hypothetical protein
MVETPYFEIPYNELTLPVTPQETFSCLFPKGRKNTETFIYLDFSLFSHAI